MIISKEAVLTSTLALLPPPLVFGRIRKCFDRAVLTFSSSNSEPKVTYTCYAIELIMSFLKFEMDCTEMDTETNI